MAAHPLPGEPASDRPRVCGVLGDPIAHSLSPALHRAGYAEVGLEWTYDAHRVPAGGLADFVAGLDVEWRGLSVTMPLKREAYALAQRRTAYAELSGAVNTLVLDSHLEGDNTDLPGAMAAIRERVEQPPGHAVILGGGATAASLGLALCELGVASLEVQVRSPERAREAVAAIDRHAGCPYLLVTELGAAPVRAPDMVVSTIPAAAQHVALAAGLHDVPCLFDAVYDPWPTPLAAAAAAASATVISGLDLLVHQAALQFTLFTGLAAPLAAMREAGVRALAARGAS